MHKPIHLKNGIPVHLIPFAGTEAVTVLVLVKVGSRYESAEMNGATHFIEHLMFKGTKKRPTAMDISRTLDRVGAEYNAYTGKERTGYYVKIDARKTDLAVDMLYDMAFKSLYEKKELDKERGVIVEEMNMYKDNPMIEVENLMESALFEGSTLGWEILGTPETVRNMPREKIIAYRDAHYVPSRIVIAIAGKVTPEVRPLLERTFGSLKEPKIAPNSFEPFTTLPSSKIPRVHVQEKPLQQIQVALGFPSYPRGDKRNTAVVLLATILGGGMSSRLFISVRERQGLAYDIRAGNDAYQDTGAFTIKAGLDRARLPLALKTIRAELRKIVKNGVTAQELKDAKEQLRGRMLLRFEDSSDRAEWYGNQELFLGKVETPEERMKALAHVTAAQVKQVAKEIFNEKNLAIGAIGPFKDGQAFLKAAEWV